MNQPVRPLVNAMPGNNQAQPPPRLHVVTPPQKGTPGGFWVRFVALIIDSFVVSIVTVPLRMLINVGIAAVMGAPTIKNPGALGVNLLIGLSISMAIVYYYFGYFYSTRGATPGKSLMGLKVLNHSTGTYLTYGQAFLRETVGKFCSGIILLMGYLMVGFRQDKRALHDLMADSEVIKRS